MDSVTPPLTVICAADTPEAEHVRRRLGLCPDEVIHAHSPESLQGVLQVDIHVIETPRFAARPDADTIRDRLRVVSVRQTPHPSWSPA
ncbi:hypothetical protein GCM10017673_39080 [Streptosporangium violaceochromogenes]|nr:hypothetical protein GCM10017673_39080 [Streptosporangium violaceochromogenes]